MWTANRNRGPRRRPRRLAATRGAVLIETIVILPLYCLLIGVTLWLGEIIWVKTRLAVADRYVAWNCGNRHRRAHGGVSQIRTETASCFFGKSRHTRIAVARNVGRNAGGWTATSAATTHGTVRMPSWIGGWLTAGSALSGAESPETVARLRGRDRLPGQTDFYGQAVFCRESMADARPFPLPYVGR